jgi:AcrR family transcriptional regulator
VSPPATRRVPRRGPGRRPGAPDTRGQVLAAARTEFAELGYDGATIRGIGARAGVDPSLVHHYFGSKEQVFAAAMELPVQPAELVAAVVAGGSDGMAERLVRTFLSIWREPRSRAPFLAMLRGALGHEAAATLLRQFVSRALLARVFAAVDVPDRELRVELAASHLVGMAILRYVVKVEPLASASEDDVVRLVTPALEHYLRG